MAVAEKVKSIIVEQLGVDEDEVTPEASFTDDLGADSLDIVELVMAFEEEFGIEIPDEEAEKISNVQRGRGLHREQRRGPELVSRPPTASANDPALKHRAASRRRHRGRPRVAPRGRHGRELAGPARREERHRPDHPLRRRRVPGADRGRGQGVRPARLRRQEGGQEERHLHPLRPGGRAASRWRTRASRSTTANADRVGVVIGSGIGGLPLIEATHQTLLEKGPEPRLAVLHPRPDRQHGGGPGLDPLRRAGPEHLAGHRLHHRPPRHRRRLPLHPARRGRRHDRRRHRGGDHAARRRPASAPCAPSPPATTSPSRPPAPGTPTATAS